MRLTVAALLLAAVPAAACPFCSTQGQTLANELNSADMIVVATVVKAIQDPADFTKSSTELRVEKTIKPHPAFADATTFSVPRYIPTPKGEAPPKVLMFCYVNTDPADAGHAALASVPAVFPQYRKATIDAYRGDEIKPNSKLPDYLEQARKLQTAPTKDRLKFYFDNLEANDLFISSDAYMEFGNADYKDVKPLAATLSPDTLTKWLTDANTAPSRYGLYGMLLGHCGKAEHAATLKKLIADPDNAFSLGLDGMLAGYLLLDPKGGWDYLSGLAADRKKEFTTRYAALRTVRFLREHRPDVTTEDELLRVMKVFTDTGDIADMAIEDLRKWGRWDQTEYVLGLAALKTHDDPLVKRAILRFAIHASRTEAKTGTAAAAYVEAERAKKPEKVKEAEDVLEGELPKKK